ncbi:MAG TPA: hypothetical protein VFY85_01075 [Gemmatimonadaceae bacterium]|nr:hypothetical protein [Gemmatimonadaceae bacterium]
MPHRLPCARLLILFALATHAPVAQAQDAPRGFDEGLFELAAPELPAVTLPLLVSPRGAFLVPVHALLSALGVPHRILRDSAQLRVSRPGSGTEVVLSWTSADSASLVATSSEVWVAAPRLAAMIDGTIDVDLATLTVHVSREGGFPAEIHEEAQQRRDDARRRLALEAGSTPPAVPFVPRTGFGVAEWSLGGPVAPFASPTSVSGRIGLGVLGGMLKTHFVTRLANAAGAGPRTEADGSFLRVFPDGHWLRQLQLGDIVSDGAQAHAMRGASITNAPFVRDLQFGEVPFAQPLPAGWEYEVYEGDRLVGFSDASGGGAVSVPLRYGTTPLRVRLYGPAGEIRESAVTFVIPVDQLHAGEWQYAAGGGRCALQQCDALGYAELRHGVRRWLTMQLGMDGLRDSTHTDRRGYGAVSIVPAAEWAVQLQARERAYVRGSLTHDGDDRVIGNVSAGMNEAGQGGIGVSTAEGAWFVSSSLRLLHLLPRLGSRGLNLGSRFERDRATASNRWDVSVSTPIRRGLLELGVQSDPLAQVHPDSAGSPIVRVAPSFSIDAGRLSGLGVPIVRLEGGFQASRLVQWEGALSIQNSVGYTNVALRKLHGIPGTQVVVSATLTTTGARLLTRVSSRAGHVDGGYSATGAVAVGSVRRATPLAYGGLGYSGVEGRVFQDVNGSGTYDTTDHPVANAMVRVGGLRVRTDSSGRYSSWSATPYERVEVELDTLSLEDPAWVPAVPSHFLRPSPHQFTGVVFPLVHTREVLGRLTPDSGMAVPAGVSLELRDSTTGGLYLTRTFGDGAFYISRMRPGRYRLTVSASSLAVLKAASPEVWVVVPMEGEEAIEVPPIALHAAAPGG